MLESMAEIVNNPIFIALLSAGFTGAIIYGIEVYKGKRAERRKIERLKKVIISELEILRHDIRHLLDYYKEHDKWPQKRSQSNFPFDALINYINELTAMPVRESLRVCLISTIPLIYDLGGGNLEFDFRGYSSIDGYKSAYDQFCTTIDTLHTSQK